MNQSSTTVRIVLSVITLAFASTTRADPPQAALRGDYAFTASGVCVISPSGFNADLVPLGGTLINSFSVSGVQTFNGDGTGSVTARVVSWAGAMSAIDATAQFAYEVAAQGTVTLQVGQQDNVFVTGPRMGQQTQVTGTPPLVGRVSSDGRSIVYATALPAVETITRAGVVESFRVCHRSQLAVQIQD